MKKHADFTILIADDEPELRDAIAFDFRARGYTVLTAGSGQEAAQIIEKQKIHVVISDLRMPDGDGIFLLERARSKSRTLPVVLFMSGFTELSLELAFEKGADAIFPKPYDRKALFAAVENAINPMSEQYSRKTTRIESNLPLSIYFPTKSKTAKGIVRNIGLGGMFLETEEGTPNRDEKILFELEMDIPHRVTIAGEGNVRWTQPNPSNDKAFGFGIEFLNLNHPSNIEFVSIINEMKTGQLEPKK